jgi:hypothetical protein
MAYAESELACWNIFSKKGSAPILKAKIVQQENLDQVTFNLKDPYFESYFEDSTRSAGEQWGNKPEHRVSKLENPKKVLDAKLITTNRSPYKGNNEYVFKFGRYSFKAPYITQGYDYGARIILPKDLSSATLNSFRIRSAQERSNAVVILSPAQSQNQSGDNFLRMFCVSK